MKTYLLTVVLAAMFSCSATAQDGDDDVDNKNVYANYECWYILTTSTVYYPDYVFTPTEKIGITLSALSYSHEGSKLAGNNDALVAYAVSRAHKKWKSGAAAFKGLTKRGFNEIGKKNKNAEAFSNKWVDCAWGAPVNHIDGNLIKD